MVRVLVLGLALAAAVLVRELWPPAPGSPPAAAPAGQTASGPGSGEPAAPAPAQPAPPAVPTPGFEKAVTPDGERAVLEAYRSRRSNVWVEVAAVVERVLPDDRAGTRHQRFIVGLTDGHTLLVSHNLDLAARAPVARGDSVRLRGEYEWNEQGGVVHWTHRDPEGRMPGGWIKIGGRTYR